MNVNSLLLIKIFCIDFCIVEFFEIVYSCRLVLKKKGFNLEYLMYGNFD